MSLTDMEAQMEQSLLAADARRAVHYHSISYDALRRAKPGQDRRRVLCQLKNPWSGDKSVSPVIERA